MKPGRPSRSRLVPTLTAAAFLSLAYLLDRAHVVDSQQVGKCLGSYWQCWFWLLGLTALFAFAAVLYMRYHTLSARIHRLANAPPLVLAILTIS